jgi:hypothetical protein
MFIELKQYTKGIIPLSIGYNTASEDIFSGLLGHFTEQLHVHFDEPHVGQTSKQLLQGLSEQSDKLMTISLRSSIC